MSKESPHTPESRESTPGNIEEVGASSASIDPVTIPPGTPEEEVLKEQVRESLRQNVPEPAPSVSIPKEVAPKNGGGYHKKSPVLVWGVEQPFAVLGYIGSLFWQGIKRWGEMAGKGGGHAKKDEKSAGGGGHH